MFVRFQLTDLPQLFLMIEHHAWLQRKNAPTGDVVYTLDGHAFGDEEVKVLRAAVVHLSKKVIVSVTFPAREKQTFLGFVADNEIPLVEGCVVGILSPDGATKL